MNIVAQRCSTHQPGSWALTFIGILLIVGSFCVGIARAAILSCGDIIIVDTVLDNNLVDCPADGIIIGADGIELNLNGKVVDGTGGFATAGIRLNGRLNVTIKGKGIVRDFGIGVAMDSSQVNRVTDIVLGHNVVGISLINSNDNRVDLNTVYKGSSGIELTGVGSNGNVVKQNDVHGFDPIGIRLINQANGNEITNNNCHANVDAIRVAGSDNNVIASNFISRNNTGVRLNDFDSLGADRNIVKNNFFTANDTGVFFEGPLGTTNNNVVRRNRFGDNTNGVNVFGATNVRNKIKRNTFSASGDAIVDTGSRTVIVNNNCVPADPDC